MVYMQLAVAAFGTIWEKPGQLVGLYSASDRCDSLYSACRICVRPVSSRLRHP